MKKDEALKKIPEELLDRYEYNDYLGSGGFSDVFLVKGKNSETQRALKVMNSNHILNMLEKEESEDVVFKKFDKIKMRFLREAELYTQFNHPNIVKIDNYGLIEDKNVGITIPYLVMEYINGVQLRDILREQESIGYSRIMQISTEILKALVYIQKTSTIHRDLKPENIIIEDKGKGKSVLIDFGLAKNVIDDFTLTTTGAAVGTLLYMAPEHFDDNSKLSIATDIYAMGVMLFEMLTGKAPFRGDKEIDIIQSHLYEPVPDIMKEQPNLPNGMGKIIKKAMAKKIEKRYQNAKEMLLELKTIKYTSLSHGS
ncbi:MAG: serine/threonine protein kinase [Candidatus Aminicenantes bacterium]|nr:serine/threonine protein kinase [Candidatus Aminicenantes bacterium]